MPRAILARHQIDSGLIALTVWHRFLEPINGIGIDTERRLLLYRTIRRAPPGVRPILDLWNIGGAGLFLFHRGEEAGKRIKYLPIAAL
jgi:hypothetical protein